MANYKTTSWVSVEDSIEVVMAAIETKLETLDSTNNTIKYIEIIPLQNLTYQACINYVIP